MSAIAVITARGGSRGLPGKNLARVGGIPLVVRAIQAGLGAARVSRVLVTSDDPEILEVAAAAGAETLIRPPELARDDTPSEPVIAHALANAGEIPEAVVLLQPTSPLRTAADVDAALALLETSGADAVISVVEPAESPWKCFFVDAGGLLHGIVDDETPFLPRQSLPRAVRPNGAIYAVRRDVFLATGRLFAARTVPYEMPRERSIDVDGAADLEAAERFLGEQSPGSAL